MVEILLSQFCIFTVLRVISFTIPLAEPLGKAIQSPIRNISLAENAEMEALRLAADRLMVRKGYALAVLRWRGHSIPPLAELPVG